ncbi:hypothetical protein EDB81DRAFT_59859 [Dactylonectria macrodidyma]|uniref:Duf1665 domain containing protein n=1 Tax=Dactylonectria macrodidyma TaxID=307937 RepID=A0A9P9EMP5_9HYPO|nr:hypothetical protein EDB81DRAFT_59859 [Dactylonectria macrodidyma]
MAPSADSPIKTGDDGTVCLPGFGIPLSYHHAGAFPALIAIDGEDWAATTLTIREVCMIRLVEDLTNKPEWWRKVKDPEIAAKWKKEALEMPWSEYVKYGHFEESMADACIEELCRKADIYEETGLIPVMDYTVCAIKSDKLIPDDLREALKAAVAPLENVPAEKLDWHPGSDGRVLDLVHPSLYPLLYGRTLILPDKRITRENCIEHCGMGTVIPEQPKVEDAPVGYRRTVPVSALSSRFQWLPCDVDLTGEHPRIESYINNLHPVQHAGLYPIIEKFIEKALPAWDIVYRWNEEFETKRMDIVRSVGKECEAEDDCGEDECAPENRPVGESENLREEGETEEDWYEGSDRQRLDEEWFTATHRVFQPDVNKNIDERMKLKASDVKTSGFFNDTSRVQVIVKLANIHLTPEKPSYDGGSWHIEGQLNERICATALYYYDCDNITDCHLDFRTAANAEDLSQDVGYQQDDHDSISRTYAIESQGDTLQDVGSVLTRADRMLFFPNVYQHHVSPFELVDKARPGHRKILAMFLIDPVVAIPSTANVPPQRLDWWAQSALPSRQAGRLPAEVTAMVLDNLDFPISDKDAKKLREELMAERSVIQENTTNNLKTVEWSFCEH